MKVEHLQKRRIYFHYSLTGSRTLLSRESLRYAGVLANVLPGTERSSDLPLYTHTCRPKLHFRAGGKPSWIPAPRPWRQARGPGTCIARTVKCGPAHISPASRCFAGPAARCWRGSLRRSGLGAHQLRRPDQREGSRPAQMLPVGEIASGQPRLPYHLP